MIVPKMIILGKFLSAIEKLLHFILYIFSNPTTELANSNNVSRDLSSKRPKLVPNRKSRMKKEEIGIPICENTQTNKEEKEKTAAEQPQQPAGNTINVIIVSPIFR